MATTTAARQIVFLLLQGGRVPKAKTFQEGMLMHKLNNDETNRLQKLMKQHWRKAALIEKKAYEEDASKS
jgi:hypothetical protein